MTMQYYIVSSIPQWHMRVFHLSLSLLIWYFWIGNRGIWHKVRKKPMSTREKSSLLPRASPSTVTSALISRGSSVHVHESQALQLRICIIQAFLPGAVVGLFPGHSSSFLENSSSWLIVPLAEKILGMILGDFDIHRDDLLVALSLKS